MSSFVDRAILKATKKDGLVGARLLNNKLRIAETQVPVSLSTFRKYDKDGSGTIDASEFADMCYDMGHYLSPEQVEQALLAMDSNGNGEIEYEEFLQWWRKGEVRTGLSWAGAGLGV